MSGKMHITNVQIVAAFVKIGNYPTFVAKKLGISYTALHKRILKNKVLQMAVDEANEHFLDVAESAVEAAIKKGDPKIAIEVMKTKGKNRGYSTRVENTGANGAPMRHTVGPDLENLNDVQLAKLFNGFGKVADYFTSQLDPVSPGGSDQEKPGETDTDS